MKKIFLALVCALFTLTAFAQQPDYISEGALLDGKNIVKVNATSLFLKTGGFSAERIITKNLSGVLGISFMPAGQIPYVNSITSLTGGDTETNDLITGIRFNTFSFSPELRIYTGRGYGRGFYLSPYYKYERFGINNLSVDIEVNDAPGNVSLGGGINTNSFGLMLGYQWLLGKKRNIVIDWTMFGAHYGSSSGNFQGKYTGEAAISEEDRQKVQQEIDNSLADLPLIKASAKVNPDNTADVTIKGPWAFLRGSVSVGFRF